MMKWLKLNIYIKLLVLFSLLSLLPLIVLGAVSYHSARKSLEENIGNNLKELARQAMERLDGRIMEHFQNIQDLSKLEVMQDVYTGDADGRIAATLINLTQSRPYYHKLSCLDYTGKVIASSESPSIHEHAALQTEFYQRNALGIFVKELVVGENETDVMVELSAPIYALGSERLIVGSLRACIDWKYFFPLLESIKVDPAAEKQTVDSHIMMINAAGTILFAPEFERLPGGGVPHSNLFDGGGVPADLIKKNRDGYLIRESEHNRSSVIAYYACNKTGYGLGWTILAVRNLAQAFAPVYKLRDFMLLSFIVLFAITILIAHLFARQLTVPIKSLTQATRRIAQKVKGVSGEFSERIQVKSSDEIGDLADAFNFMSGELARARTELEEKNEKLKGYAHNLEDKVKARTAELEQANHELRDTQTQLVQSAKLASIGQLAAGVSHELNNPLGGILGYSQFVLQMRKGKDLKDLTPDRLEKMFTYVGYIERESLRCKTIVANLLKFSRSSKTNIAPLDINQVLEETFIFTQHQLDINQVELVQKLAPRLPRVMANGHQLQQVFTNLIVNAQQAMKKGGELTVSTAVNNGTLEISFTDTGYGIPKENMDKLFDPFFTSKEVGEGTGLGLSVSYGIIKDFKGDIEVESKEGKGTTFHIKLPIEKGDKKTAPMEGKSYDGHRRK